MVEEWNNIVAMAVLDRRNYVRRYFWCNHIVSYYD
jgi:hypothetical protein